MNNEKRNNRVNKPLKKNILNIGQMLRLSFWNLFKAIKSHRWILERGKKLT